MNKNIFTMSHREKRRLRIGQLPANLSEALDELEWEEYISHVHPWEQERYLAEY